MAQALACLTWLVMCGLVGHSRATGIARPSVGTTTLRFWWPGVCDIHHQQAQEQVNRARTQTNSPERLLRLVSFVPVTLRAGSGSGRDAHLSMHDMRNEQHDVHLQKERRRHE
jgi:hypothetical protein